MNHLYDNQERERLLQARESYSGRLLTDSQFDEAVAITGVIEREILKSGKFKEKLGDYAHAFARTEKFDGMKGEEIIRDLFKARCGETMNQMRETLAQRESEIFGWGQEDRKDGAELSHDEKRPLNLSDAEKGQAHQAALESGRMVKEGNKMPFYRAQQHQAAGLARELQITDYWARAVMTEQFEQKENKQFYSWGKDLENEYYRPQIEAETQARQSKHGNVADVNKGRRFGRFR